MNNMNSIIIEGAVTEKLEVKTIVGNNRFCCINICCKQCFKNASGEIEEYSNYFDVYTYGELAEKSAKKADKDCVIRIVGKLWQSTHLDCNGKKNSRIVVLAEAIDFLSYANGLRKKQFFNKN